MGNSLKLWKRPEVVCVEHLSHGARAAVTGISAMNVAETIKKAAAGSGLSIYVFNSDRGVEIIVRGVNACGWLQDFLQTLLPVPEKENSGMSDGNL